MKQSRASVFLSTSEDTFAFGKKIGKHLSSGSILCFFGNLGAGKTTLIKGIGSSLQIDPETVFSPTFQLLNIYQTNETELCHFDLYRLKNADEFLSLGFDEWLTLDRISCIEWAERIESILPVNVWKIRLEVQDGGRRVQIQTPKEVVFV